MAVEVGADIHRLAGKEILPADYGARKIRGQDIQYSGIDHGNGDTPAGETRIATRASPNLVGTNS
jgi:hypothetical protein